MKFSIVTPSFRNSEWLKLCIPSVADQGVDHEHIVQDAGSDDGTLDWLPHDPRVTAYVEKDRGMYDAVNRGYRRASGDILAYLNCDEQYLPGALQAVGRYFEENPEIDVAIADIVVTDRNGDYLCHRYALRPYWTHLWTRFNVSTAALFLRRRVLAEHDLYFEPHWKHLGDFFLDRSGRAARIAFRRASFRSPPSSPRFGSISVGTTRRAPRRKSARGARRGG